MNKGTLGHPRGGATLRWQKINAGEFIGAWSWDADDTTRPAYAVFDDLVFLRGICRLTSGTYSFPTQIFRLPPHARPLYIAARFGAPVRDPFNGVNVIGDCNVGTDGIFTQTGTWTSISGIGGNTNSLQYLYGVIFPRHN